MYNINKAGHCPKMPRQGTAEWRGEMTVAAWQQVIALTSNGEAFDRTGKNVMLPQAVFNGKLLVLLP